MNDARKVGRVTIPTDLDVVPETLEIMKRWGADAIRDCDGTDFPAELQNQNAKIYSTYYTTRKDNVWAKANPDEVQQCYIMTGFHTASGGPLSIELMKEMHIDIQHIVPLGMHMFHNPCFHISEHNVELFNHYLYMIRLVSNKKANHSVKVIQGLLSSMLAFTHEVMEQEVGNAGTAKGERINNRNMRLFEEFMALLTENFRSEHQIGFYADKLCLTPKYLSLLIKQTSGRSVSDWIDHCIIMEAKSLLRYSDLSIQQVAYTLHFPTPSFFGTYFKRHVGMTPGDFRQGDEKLMGE